METTVPFMGFYNSIHDSQLDFALESMFSDDRGHVYPKLLEEAFDSVNWKACHDGYAKQFTEAFSCHYRIDLKFKLLSSPKYYNFETDRIICEIDESEVLRLWSEIDRDKLQEKIRKNFTSYDGFCSFYPNDLDRWAEDVTEWDHNQLGALIACYIESHEDYREDWEVYLLDDLHEVAYNLINEYLDNERVWKLLNYLRDRENRKVA
jgi:hypothetical protein